MATSRRLLVLALDAASPSLLRRWAATGELPTLDGLLRRGRHAETRSVEGLFVGATWPSFYTGCGPATHGVYWLDRLRAGTYRIQGARPGDFARRPALWEVLSAAGHDVVVLDVPLTRLSPRLRGPQVREWGVHDTAFGFGARPRQLGRRILDDIGEHPVPASCDARRDAPSYLRFADQLIQGAAARARLTRDVLASHRWDFAIQVFSETHCAGHQLWHFHDPDHPGHGTGSRNLLLEVYQAVDRALGAILADVPADTTVVVMSLHSMGPTGGASLILSDVLERLGVYHPDTSSPPTPETPPPGIRPDVPSSGETDGRAEGRPLLARSLAGARALYHRLPAGIRSPLYDLRQTVNQRVLGRGTPLGFDPARSRAFPVALGLGAPFSGIRFNLRGREPRGIVAPGREADALREELTRALLALTNGSGEPVVRKVHATAELHQGPRLHELPDLLVEWRMDPPLGTTAVGSGEGARCEARSSVVGAVVRENRYCRTGEHRPEGFLVAAGPGVEPGQVEGVISSLDLAPTFAAVLGCLMPTAEGRVRPDLLT